MIRDEQLIQLIWIFVFAVILMVFLCLVIRCIFLFLLERNCCNLQTIFSNTRILQTSREKKMCNALDLSLQKAFKESNIERILPITPQFMASAGGSSNHWPMFQVAVDGKILNPELLVATRVPDYAAVVGNRNTASDNENMLTDYYRNNMQQQNSSLDHHSGGSFGHSGFGSYSSDARVPTDRPLYINTSMSAQQRVDIYRQLSDPPKDSEPALTFSFRNL